MYEYYIKIPYGILLYPLIIIFPAFISILLKVIYLRVKNINFEAPQYVMLSMTFCLLVWLLVFEPLLLESCKIE